MSSKEYQLMKFNILTMALHPELAARIDDAYVFAWARGVYPFFHDGVSWHDAFAEDFSITMEMMDELSKRLDDAWSLGNGVAPKFYELEDEFGIRRGHSKWDRSSLIGALRYMALSQGIYNRKFFAQITRDAGAPTEANSFAEPFDRDRDIYFM